MNALVDLYALKAGELYRARGAYGWRTVRVLSVHRSSPASSAYVRVIEVSRSGNRKPGAYPFQIYLTWRGGRWELPDRYERHEAPR